MGAQAPLPRRAGMPRLRAAALLLLLGLVPAAAAGALDGSLTGSYKSFLMGIYDIPPAQKGELYGSAENALRLQARLYPSRSSLLEAHYVLRPRLRSESLSSEAVSGGGALTGGSFALGSAAEYRAADFADLLLPADGQDEHNLGVYHGLDRLYGGLYLPFGDLYAGRQAVSFGSAHVINPTDIFAPFTFTSLNTEHTRGVDAVRLRLPTGVVGEIDLGYVAGEEFAYEESAFFGRATTYLGGTDISLMGADFRENLLIGTDLAGSVGGAGAWLEAAYVLPDSFSPEGPNTGLQYVRASAGMDYNFGPKLYGYAEYHFNSAGRADPQDYAGLYADMRQRPSEVPAYSEGGTYLAGRHYAGLGGTYTLTPLLPLSGLVLVNVQDLSANLSLSAEYNFTENVYLEAGAYLGIGREPELVSQVPYVTEYESEFGAYPQLFYTSVNIYF